MLSRHVLKATVCKSAFRCFATTNTSRLSMLEELPNTPKLKPARDLKKPETMSTTLPCGLTVATRETYETVSSIGIFVGSGSADEEVNEYGSAYMMEKMAFKSTENRSRETMVKNLEDIGANLITRSGRDSIMYIVDTLRGNVEKCVSMFADTVMHPLLQTDEIEESSHILDYENEDSMMKRDYSAFSMDYLHAAMYGMKTPYGHPLRYHNPNLNHEILQGYWKKHFRPENMKIVGIGVEHEKFVQLVEKYFTYPSSQPVILPKTYSSTNEILKGGQYHTDVNGMDQTQVNLGLHCDGWSSKHMVSISLLQTLLGGGSMFSAGGPGKGMYSRLYTDVMNRYGWFESCNIQLIMYRNQGLVTLQCLVPFTYVSPTTKILCDHIRRLIGEPVSDEEFMRSKNQLKSMIFMNLEQRSIYCEEIGQQFLSYGKHKPPEEWAREIDALTKEDIMVAVQEMLNYPICFSVFGKDVTKEINTLPPVDGINAYLKMPYK
ncbi:hypothetical protein WA171_000832 [Blastocystis sp. BT1]